MADTKAARRNANRRRAFMPEPEAIAEEPKLLTGPHSYYRPKARTISVQLTVAGAAILDAARAATSASTSDIVEQLLRRFGARVRFRE